MDDDLEAAATFPSSGAAAEARGKARAPRKTVAAAIASLASSGAAAEARGKACAPRKAAVPSKKKKKELTPEEHVVESAKRNGWRHAQDARGEAADAAAAKQEDTIARVKAAMRKTLLCLGVNPSQHVLVAPVVAVAASMDSSAYPRMMPPESPPVSILAPSTPAPVTIDLNNTSVTGRSSSGGMRKHQREMPACMLTDTRNLFDGMSTAVDNDTANCFLENMIFEGGAPAAGAYFAAAYHPMRPKARTAERRSRKQPMIHMTPSCKIRSA
ncbi:DNA repair protein rhp54 [Hordeum vulgare]|nr:DNA repair protein rhp54 [Hordeum vulgare]